MKKEVENKLIKRLSSLAFMFVLLFGLMVPFASANGTEQVKYLALGDSLAAGMTPDRGISDGYADLTAKYLKNHNMLATYSKDFAVPGYTTQNVLDDLAAKPELREAIKQSNFITLSAGANDLLKDAKLDPEKKVLILDQDKVMVTLHNVAENYTKILQTIKALNPNASVYVMGYYFPFPYISDVQKPQLIQLTHTLNTAIQMTATAQGASFVSVYEKFGDDSKPYLPNPENIHPNLAGYQLMSDALLESMAKNNPTATDIPAGFWAEKELNFLLTNHLLTLDEKGKVYPEKAITRAEAAEILFKNLPLTTTLPNNPGFKDVPVTHPAYLAIAKLTEAGIFSKSDYFNPDAPLNRVQTAKVLSKAFDLKSDGILPSYKDINASYWAAPYIDAVGDHKIMVGYRSGKFGLYDATNRAQFAVIVVRVQAMLSR